MSQGLIGVDMILIEVAAAPSRTFRTGYGRSAVFSGSHTPSKARHFSAWAARLKSCPDTKHEFFPQPVKSCPDARHIGTAASIRFTSLLCAGLGELPRRRVVEKGGGRISTRREHGIVPNKINTARNRELRSSKACGARAPLPDTRRPERN